MLNHLATILSVICIAGAAYCVISVFRCTIKVVSARKDGVPITRAMAGTNILFKPELYKPEARKWAHRYVWSFICCPLFFFAAFVLMILRQWITE
jgi:hypothetical protein